VFFRDLVTFVVVTGIGVHCHFDVRVVTFFLPCAFDAVRDIPWYVHCG
jgi:hypothetical protein